jgi:hypothetical protein
LVVRYNVSQKSAVCFFRAEDGRSRIIQNVESTKLGSENRIQFRRVCSRREEEMKRFSAMRAIKKKIFLWIGS